MKIKIYLEGFASIPDFNRLIASSVLPTLLVHINAMYLEDLVRCNNAQNIDSPYQISPKNRMRMTALR